MSLFVRLYKYIVDECFLYLIALVPLEIYFNAELISPVFIELVYNKRNGTCTTPNLHITGRSRSNIQVCITFSGFESLADNGNNEIIFYKYIHRNVQHLT